ncbi:hypothetical protein [Streptomyces buecherae]|uniref:hypothetical protein n=1 Tax=Streptomyces buecherae TaxID=2763006 RepID=UPI0036BD9F70
MRRIEAVSLATLAVASVLLVSTTPAMADAAPRRTTNATSADTAASATPTVSLDRYLSRTDHRSTVWGAPAGYRLEGSLGGLYTAPVQGAHALYSCADRGDHYVSTQANCEGSGYTFVGRLGWAYSTPPAGVATLPLYRCLTRPDRQHFETNDANCEGQIVEGLLGHTVLG